MSAGTAIAHNHGLRAIHVLSRRFLGDAPTVCFDEIVDEVTRNMFIAGCGATLGCRYAQDEPSRVVLENTPGWRNITQPVLADLLGVVPSTISHSWARTENRRLTQELIELKSNGRKKTLDTAAVVA